jgi:hypothetical protein
MSFGKIAAFSAILSGTVVALSAHHAAAAPAVTGTNVNLRQGPGTTYTVITLIPAGAPVEISGCNAGWCQAAFQGQNGYIIATSIAAPGGPGGPPPGAVAGPDQPIPIAPGAPPPGYYPPPPGYMPPPPPYYYGYYGPYYGYGPYWRGGYYGRRRW